MANLKALDGDSTEIYLGATGAGTDLDPLRVLHSDPVAQDLLQELVDLLPIGLSNGKLVVEAATSDALLVTVRDRLIDIVASTDTLETLLTNLNAYADGLETLLTTTNSTQSAIEANQATQIARTPILGPAVAANSMPVVLSSDGPFATNFGLANSAPAISDTAPADLIALIKRLLSVKLPSALLGDRLKTDSLVRSLFRKWRDDFAGTALNPAAWSVIQAGAGQSITVGSSELTIASGTTANSETILRSVESFTIPFRVFAIYLLNQRIINQEFYIEVVDSTGGHYAQWLFNGVSGSEGRIATANAGNGLPNTAVSFGFSTAYQIVEIELSPDEINFCTRISDSASVRGQGAVRTRQIPDPNLQYFVQIRAKNLGTAPASTTNFKLDSIAVQDIEEITAELTAGRGGGNLNQSIPITAPSSIPVNFPVATSVYDFFSYFTDFAALFTANQVLSATARNSLLQRNRVRGTLLTDQLGTITIEQSADATVYIQTHIFTPATIPSTLAFLFSFELYRQYYRIKYTNGGTASTTMNLSTAMFANGSS